MSRDGWWSIRLELNNEEIYWNDLSKETQEYIIKCIKDGYCAGAFVLDYYFEAIEICPWCEEENVYPMWDVDVKGFVAVCEHCGKEILLCDECIHHEDGLNANSMGCDWCDGKCFRGMTKD